jgi:hypothetical protein
MEETKLVKKKAKQTKTKIRINTSSTRTAGKLLRLIAQQNPERFTEIPFGDKGDVIWLPPPFSDPDLNYIGNRIINFLPGFQDISQKKELSMYLATMTEFFPEQYTFYPKTWLLPEQATEIGRVMKRRSGGCYIVKPTASSEGDGISIVRSKQDLRNLSMTSDSVVQEYIDPPALLYK